MANLAAGDLGDETPEERLARLRNEQGGGIDPRGPVGPTGPTGPGPGYTAPSAPAKPTGVQSPDAQDLITNIRSGGAIGPTGPLNSAGQPGGKGPSNVDQFTALQALGNQTPAPATGAVQSPDAQSRNFETNNPAPEGFEWKNGVLTQKVPGSTIIPPKTISTPTTTTVPPTGVNGGTPGGGGGSGPTGGGVYNPPPVIPRTPITATGDSDISKSMVASGGDGDTTGGSGPGGGGSQDLSGGGGLGGGGGFSGITGDIMNQLSDLQNEVNNPQAPADVALMYRQQLSQILSMIDQEETRIRAEADAAGSQLDPATEFTLSKMREELDRQLKTSDESANSRGLLDSGVRAQMEIELRKGNMSDQAMVLSSRLSKIQEDLRKGLSSLSNRKLDTATDLGTRGVEGQLTENRFQQGRTDDLGNRLLQGRLGIRGQLSSEAEQEADRQQRSALAAQDAQARLQAAREGREFDATQQSGQNEFTARQNELNRQADMERQLLDIRSGKYAGSSGGGTTNLTRPAGTTSLGQDAVDNLRETHVNGQSATTKVQNNEAKLRRDGLNDNDIAALYDAANQLDGGGYSGDLTGVSHGR